VLAAGVEGDFAAVTAGWEEREDEIDELRAHLDRRVVNLRLYARSEEVFRADPEFAEGFRERRRRLRELSDLHRIRLDHARRAERRLMQAEGDPELLEPERAAALDDVRRLDEHQRRRIAEVHADFEEVWRPAERDAVAAHRREVAELLSACSALAIAGGNVAVLIHRLRLFDVESHVGHLAVFAWSAGAMACSEEIVLYHDHPPQGPGHPEVFGAGLGLVPDVLPLPHASRRLRLDDAARVATFARRFAPRVCVAMDRGHGMAWERGAWTSVAGGARRLTEDGEVVEMFAP
jgi:peptidase S51-like protein